MESSAALLIIDVQNDFCPGGALAVRDAERILNPVNLAAARFAAAGLPVLASRDWHPADCGHFVSRGGQWPPHCVQGTTGAAFHPELRLPEGTILISKGTDPCQDGYSAFEGADGQGRDLQTVLAALGVRHLYVAGLATDYCVVSSARDALHKGFEVTVLTDAVAGVDLEPGDSKRALHELEAAGAHLASVSGP